MRLFSHELEKNYYSQQWPYAAKPYLHLEPYLRCWFDPDTIFRGKRVLDIGAGECVYTRLIAERFAPREIVACELFRQRMLPTVLVNRNINLKFVNGDTFHLPFQSKSFEVIFGSGILCQLPQLEQVIPEIQRVCTEKGIYVGIEPSPYCLVHLYRYFFRRHSPNHYLFGPKHLSAFKNAGFEVIIKYFYGKFPHIRNRLLGTCMGIIAKSRDE